MRLLYILLVAAVVLLSTVDATSATTSSKVLVGDLVDTVSKRFLRTDTALDKDDENDSDEERGFVLPGFAQKISKLSKSSVQNVKGSVSQFRVDNKFWSLGLFLKGWLPSPEMKKWAEYVTKLYKNDPEKSAKAMLRALTKYRDEFTVARWAQAAKGSPHVDYVGHNVQFVQFAKWMDEGQDALSLAKLLEKTAVASDTMRDKVIVQAFATFIKQRKSV